MHYKGQMKSMQRILKRNKPKKQSNSTLIEKKLVYKSKRKENSEFINREFSTLTALIMMTLMN